MKELIDEAIRQLEGDGFCVLPELMPADGARELAARCLELHADPANASHISAQEGYQTLFGMVNRDERTWDYAFHDVPVAIARHFLGASCRVVESCSKPTWPGAPAGPLHADSAGHFVRRPDIPWMINSIWMLTDFTVDNGATGVVPGSHRDRDRQPHEIDVEGDEVKPVCGCAGSLVMWHGGTFHMARANRSDAIRVGLNIAYYPRWFNNWIENGHQPVWPEIWERMPERIRALVPGRQGRDRDEMYEKRPGD